MHQNDDTTPTVEWPLHNVKREIVGATTIYASDVHLIKDRYWNLDPKGYARRGERHNGILTNISMHQVILGIPSGMGRYIQVDHKDRNGLNNRRSNLRLGTFGANRQNVGSHRGSSSRFRGVSWNKACQKWIAKVDIAGTECYLGLFDDEEEAGRIASDFRRLNMPYAIED